MARPILTDEQWRRVESVLPPPPPRRRVPGPHPIQDRAVLGGILFVLRDGIPWQNLPADVGAGSGMTCLRRLRQWQRDGMWEKIRRVLSGAFSAGEIDWRRAEKPPRARRRRLAPEHAVREALAQPRAGTAPSLGDSIAHGPVTNAPGKPRGSR
jgi:transposase